MSLSKAQLKSIIDVLNNNVDLQLRSDNIPFVISLLIDHVIVTENLDMPRLFTDEYLDKMKHWND